MAAVVARQPLTTATQTLQAVAMMQSWLITVCASLIERQRETVSPSRKETHKGASLGERFSALANTKRLLRQ
jgi:hypothetical protein